MEGHRFPEQLLKKSEEGPTHMADTPRYFQKGLISMKPQWNENEGHGTLDFELACWLNRCAGKGNNQQDIMVVTGHSLCRRVRLDCGYRERGYELHDKRSSKISKFQQLKPNFHRLMV